MALIFLDRIDAAPIANNDFPFEFNQWLAVLVDTLNEDIQTLQNSLRVIQVPQYTSAQITALASTFEDGVLLYDTTLNEYVGQISGALVKFTTTPYP